MKFCKRCNINKEFKLFSRSKRNKDGLNNWCKDCSKEYLNKYYLENKELYSKKSKEYYEINSNTIKENVKNWKKNNLEYTKEYHRNYYSENKEQLLQYKKEHYIDNRDIYLYKAEKWREYNKESYLEYLKNWRECNKEYSREYLKEWYINNREKRSEYYHKVRINKPHLIAWRSSLKLALKRLGRKKESSTIDILGYSAFDLKLHIEPLFKDGMSWDNWGEWHIDHKIPISRFDKDTPINVVNSLDNLQPLWALDNLSKSNKIEND